MINQPTSNPDNINQVYGFLCQKTNVFYAFETQETYQQFLTWLSTQEATTDDFIARTQESNGNMIANEAEKLADYEMATREIMEVFEDPVFEKMEEEVELQEIDF